MSMKSRQLGQTKVALLAAAFTLTGTPNTPGFSAPSGQTVALLQNLKLTEWISTGEVLRPLGINVQVTTTITVTNPVYQLQKAAATPTGAVTFASPSSGGAVTGTLVNTPGSQYLPFSTYVAPNTGASLFTADAAGDQWSVKVTTSPTAGAANILLHYAQLEVAGISDAVTTL